MSQVDHPAIIYVEEDNESREGSCLPYERPKWQTQRQGDQQTDRHGPCPNSLIVVGIAAATANAATANHNNLNNPSG